MRLTSRQAALPALLGLLMGCALWPLAPVVAAENRLEVRAGYAGFHVPGRALPVQVTVTADRPLKGELVVKEAGGEREATRPVELSGGTAEQVYIVLPGGVRDPSGAVRVELLAGGKVLMRGRGDLKAADDAELVGLGPKLLEAKTVPGPATLAVDAGVARFSALDPALLSEAPASLAGLSTVGLASGELAALGPGARAGLLRWVGSGGHLLIDAPPGTAVDGLPSEWQPPVGPGQRPPGSQPPVGPGQRPPGSQPPAAPGQRAPGSQPPAGSDRAAAGLGEVRLTGDAMTAGRFAGLVEPSSAARDNPGAFTSPGSVADSLARDAGLRLPSLAWLGGFLGVYIIVVGPLTGLVLRRRRRPDLAWVVVPGLAIVFTALAYGAGNQLRPGAGLAHGSIVETGPSGSVATSWVALTRRHAGTAHIDLPAGWAVGGALPTRPGECFGGDCSSYGDLEPPSVSGDSGAGTQVRLPLASGEFGVFKASGPVPLEGRLEVSASSPEDGVASGTVRNGLAFALDEVVVLVGSYGARVGRLAPGEQRTWSVGPGDRLFNPSGAEPWMTEVGGWTPYSSGLESWMMNEGGNRSDGLVNLPLWQAAQGDLGRDGDPTGTALAAGWTREWKPAVAIDGSQRQASGRTAVVGRAPVRAAAGRVTDMVAAADVVRGPSLNPSGTWFTDGTLAPSVVKLTLPPGAADRRLVLRSGPAMSDVAVWRGGAWQRLEVSFVDVDPQPLPDTGRPPLAPGQVTPPGREKLPPPPLGPDGVLVTPGGGRAAEVRLPAGTGSDDVIFVRLTIDPRSATTPYAALSLSELGR